jgi:xanthine dehydrogenase accessory factor
LPKPQLIIIGRSPVAQTLAQLGELLDFKVTAFDPEPSSVRNHIKENSFVVVATMGNGDEEGVLSVVGTRPRYLGLVASEKKSKALFAYAREKGATDEDIARIKCPAGVELGGQTLPEIALSVAAEIVRVRRASVEQQTTPEQPATKGVAFDPICGMTVDVDNAKYTSVVNGETVYFCCLRCKETFDRPPISQLTRIGK